MKIYRDNFTPGKTFFSRKSFYSTNFEQEIDLFCVCSWMARDKNIYCLTKP